MKLSCIPLIGGLALLAYTGCNKDSDYYPDGRVHSFNNDSVSTNDPNRLQTVMKITNGKLKTGTFPQASGSQSGPVINSYQTTCSFNPGMIFQLPLAATSQAAWKYLCVHVDSATNGYIQVTDISADSSGIIVVPISLPGNVKYGTFSIEYCLVDANNNVSNVIHTSIVLRAPMTCSGASMSGAEGLTATLVHVGKKAGTISLNYDTYTVPDRLDVYQGSTWLTGTGPNTGLPVPPLCNCNNVLPGFYGQSGTLTINFDPAKGEYITVYVSGCLGSGTAWEWNLDCPQ